MMSAIPHFNDICRFNSEIVWWGPMLELLGGFGNYERGLRQKWRRVYRKISDDSPITDEDSAEFISVLNYMMDVEN